MKPTKALPDIHLDEDDLHNSVERAFDLVKKSIQGITASDIVAGTLVSNVDLSTAAKRVEHRLGRKPVGYIVVRRNANATVYDLAEDREDLFLNLKAGGVVTVSLWVF